MALTQLGDQLTAAHRAAQLAVRANSLRDLLTLWRGVDVTRLGDTIDVFVRAAVLLAGRDYDTSAALAAQYLSLFREAEGVQALANAVAVAARPNAVAVAADLRGAALKGIIDGRKAGMGIEQAKANGLIRVTGAMTKQVLAGGRMTIIGSAHVDRAALGWARVTSGDPCTFCRSLAARGPVYKSEKSAGFEAHEHCSCSAEIIYPGPQITTGRGAQQREYAAEYKRAQAWARASGTMSDGTTNDSLNNYRRWLANGKPEPGSKPTTAPAPATPQGGSSDAG
jgi:hypothetical protein